MTLKKWLPEEDNMLRRLYRTTPAAELADRLGRTRNCVVHRARTLKLKSQRWWSPEQLEALRAGWGTVPGKQLARAIGRDYNAVKQTALRLGLDAGRLYTPAQIAFVKANYATMSAARISEALFGSQKSVTAIYALAHRLGLRKWPSWPEEVLEFVRRRHADGLVDREIAESAPEHFCAGPAGRLQVRCIRDRLRLAANRERARENTRDNWRKQQATTGLAIGELRPAAYRRYAAENGWPEDLRPREVQILNVLAAGPRTRVELAAAIGMRTDRIGGNGAPALLTDNGRDGTYTSSLLKRDLIVRVERYQTGQPHGKNRLPGLYLLSAMAIGMLEAREKCATSS